MATLRDIKRRIMGVKSTQQITKAMKMVAAARLRRAQENIMSARPYSQKIAEVLSHLIKLEKGSDNPLFKEVEGEKTAIIVVTSDRGLCGSFNMNAIRMAEDMIKHDLNDIYKNGNISLYCIGKKGVDYFKAAGYSLTGAYPGIFSDLRFEFASSIVDKLTKKFLDGELDRVMIVYNQFKSVMQQVTKVEQLLPIAPFETEEEKDEDKYQIDYIYEPDRKTIIERLLPKHLKAQFWKVLLDSFAAELGARMTAMDMATENAKELIRQLNITYNKERQSAITTEILEIVSGANALKDA